MMLKTIITNIKLHQIHTSPCLSSRVGASSAPLLLLVEGVSATPWAQGVRLVVALSETGGTLRLGRGSEEKEGERMARMERKGKGMHTIEDATRKINEVAQESQGAARSYDLLLKLGPHAHGRAGRQGREICLQHLDYFHYTVLFHFFKQL